MQRYYFREALRRIFLILKTRMDYLKIGQAHISPPDSHSVMSTFEAKVRKLLGDSGFEDMLEFLAKRSKAGQIIQGTGGLRKVHIARLSRGKRGGVRVVYYHHEESKPIFLLPVYAKADQEDMSTAQKAQLKKIH